MGLGGQGGWSGGALPTDPLIIDICSTIQTFTFGIKQIREGEGERKRGREKGSPNSD